MTAERFDGEDILKRDSTDPGSIADGDAQLDNEPPNVESAQPPADSITRGPGEGRGSADAAAQPGGRSQAGVDAGSRAAGPGAAGSSAAGSEPNPAGAESGSETDAEQIESDIDELRREFSTLSDRHIRLAAEFDNYRKRIERERADTWTRAQGDLAARLLDALDDLERFSQHAAESDDALLQGVQLVERKLRQSLQAAGLEEVEADGARFDPNSMEAVAMVPVESQAEDDLVSDVFQRGYRFKGSLIRPARVRVKKHGA